MGGLWHHIVLWPKVYDIVAKACVEHGSPPKLYVETNKQFLTFPSRFANCKHPYIALCWWLTAWAIKKGRLFRAAHWTLASKTKIDGYPEYLWELVSYSFGCFVPSQYASDQQDLYMFNGIRSKIFICHCCHRAGEIRSKMWHHDPMLMKVLIGWFMRIPYWTCKNPVGHCHPGRGQNTHLIASRASRLCIETWIIFAWINFVAVEAKHPINSSIKWCWKRDPTVDQNLYL